MKQRSLHKREIALIIVAIISLLLVIVSVVYITNLQRTITDNNRIYGATLTTKDNELNEMTSYNDTICGEYRKLYSAYNDLLGQGHFVGGSGYALPGSAKGEVDECYRPQ